MRKLLEAFLIGIGYGTIVYVSCLYIQGVETQTLSNIASVALFSGVIGIVSLIFLVDALALKWQLLIHFLAVFGLIVGMNAYNGFTDQFFHPLFLGGFVLIYVLVWLVVLYLTHEKVNRINHKLEEKRKNKS